MMQKILLSNLFLKRLMKKINLIETTEINLDEAIEDNEEPKKKGFLKKLKDKFNNLEN